MGPPVCYDNDRRYPRYDPQFGPSGDSTVGDLKLKPLEIWEIRAWLTEHSGRFTADDLEHMLRVVDGLSTGEEVSPGELWSLALKLKYQIFDGEMEDTN